MTEDRLVLTSASQAEAGIQTEESQTTEQQEVIDMKPSQLNVSKPAAIGIGVGILLLLLALAAAFRKKKEAVQEEDSPKEPVQEMKNREPVGQTEIPNGIGVGKVHHIGKRNQQQDCFGMTGTPSGVFAVVADGMGGLADGDKVSQKVVATMLQEAVQPSGNSDRRLYHMVARANEEVNRMLGAAGQYKSGSTLVAVLAEQGRFEWVSVGDSRIYLYRGGRLMQLNREHNYEAELLQMAVNGDVSFAEVQRHPQRKGLTSFIGMGKLKYIDGSPRAIEIQAGDMLLLMSDGVFNTLPEQEMCEMIQNYGQAEQIAEAFEKQILDYGRLGQDNFTVVMLQF